MTPNDGIRNKTQRNPDLAGAEVAMRRAAERAHRLAQDTPNVETNKVLGPDGLLGGLTPKEVGRLRRRWEHAQEKDEFSGEEPN